MKASFFLEESVARFKDLNLNEYNTTQVLAQYNMEPFLSEPWYGDISVVKTCGEQEWIVCSLLIVQVQICGSCGKATPLGDPAF